MLTNNHLSKWRRTDQVHACVHCKYYWYPSHSHRHLVFVLCLCVTKQREALFV